MKVIPRNPSLGWLEMLAEEEKRLLPKMWNQCTQAEKIERWRNVLRVLLSLSPHERQRHFTMNTWGELTPCGTVACAAGHCGMDPWFRSQGFIMDPHSDLSFTTLFPSTSPEEFFGQTGHYGIFIKTYLDFQGVVEAVKDFIHYLESHRGVS